ncbi:MAG: fibronectin type III domain-containing protein [Elusimicrobiales bacterium]|nr:fibronectin type III domain-containing protein [Elusimicrobiales bacterium]
MRIFCTYIFLYLIVINYLSTFLNASSESRLVLLPNSNILICGGRHQNSNLNDDCYVLYSEEYGVSVTTPVYYYPNILSTSRYAHTMTLLPDGRILVAGGYNTSGTPQNTADIITLDYNVINSTSRTTLTMLYARANHTATLLTRGPDAGNVLICGGTNNNTNTLDSCEIFITSSNQFKIGPTLTSRREGHAANLLPNGKVFFTGGFQRPDIYHITTELYDPTTNSMTPGPSLIVGRSSHTAVTLANGYTIIIGGYNGNITSPEVFSKDSFFVQQLQGQYTYGYVDVVEMFDANGARAPIGFSQVNTGSYDSGISDLFPYRMANHSSLLLNDGSVYVVGGRGNIPVTYIAPQVTASEGSYILLSNPEVIVATGTRRASITSTNIMIELPQIRLSRYITGRLINADWFIPPKVDGSPTAQLSSSYVYLQKTTVTLDTVFVGGNSDIGYGWLEQVEVPLQGPGSGAYALFLPLLSQRSDDGNGSARLQISGASLSSGTKTNLLNTSTATITLSFIMPQEYWGANIIGATVTLISASYSDNMLRADFTDGRGEITGVSIGLDGKVNVSVAFAQIQGSVENTTTTALTFPRNISGSFSNINFSISYTVNRINFISDTAFSVDPSTIVVRDALFSNLVRYYPQKNQVYLNDDELTGISFSPSLNHSTILRRSGSITIYGGENCEENPSNCSRTSIITSPYSVIRDYSSYHSSNWHLLPPMKNKRAFHTLNVLNDGSILACGGTDGEKTLSNCEMFNEIYGEWVIVATMSIARAYHTATLLPNGTVLLAGGTSGRINESAALNDAEIFYPDVRKTVKTSSLNKPRLLHTATLLPDGNVLFTGGASSNTYLSSAELFITTANVFIEIGNMSVPRSEHTATLLPNGTVLITGGINGSGSVLNSCEIFNVLTRTFSSTDSMGYRRKSHTATLLDNGVVVVFGGSNNNNVVNTMEVYNPSMPLGSRWRELSFVFLRPREDKDNDVYIGRANHKAVLLPDKTVVYVGGESIDFRSVVKSVPEKLNSDVLHLTWFGKTERKIGTGVVLSKNNYIVSVGGFDGRNNYLDKTEAAYYSFVLPDQESLSSMVPRKPFISSATYISDNGNWLIIRSTYSNLHSLVEAGGSGSSARHSDFSKPYIILTSLNGDYTVNFSTMLYVTTYNSSWTVTLSTISVRVLDRNKVPYGWYYLHVCVESNCSDGFIIQISTPRPQCVISTPTVNEVWYTSMSWRWNLQNISAGTVANGFAVFSSSDIFISTLAFPTPQTAITTFTLTGLLPNTPSSLKVGCYNIGGFSDKKTWAVAISTLHTLANPPKDLKITHASFDTVSLEWDGNGNNSKYTSYQVEVSTDNLFNTYSIAINFANNYTDTKATIRNLQPNWRYYFRVKARNGDGIPTLYDTQTPGSSTLGNPVSTITVGNIVGLNGLPLATDTIKWMWNPAGGADGYEIYDYKIIEDPNDPIFRSTIDVSVLITTTPYTYYSWINLNTNSPYQVKVRSFKIDGVNIVYGPFSVSPIIHTLASEPKPAYPNVFSEITTGSLKITWDSNGNSTSTLYKLEVALDEKFFDVKNYDAYSESIIFPYVSYTVTDLKPNTRYYARVYAINRDGIMNPVAANLGSKYTLAQPPPRVYVSSVSIRGVRVNWETEDNPPYTIYQVRATSVTFESPYISTPVPFGIGYTSNNYLITGLWFNTTYYFDVTARNMEGVETLSMQTATPAFIVAGIVGAPSGSTGGEVIPTEDTVIKGILADGRSMTATFYKGTFIKPEPVAITSLSPAQLYSLVGSSNPCGYTFNGSTIAFGIYSNEQPYIPIKFTFNYFTSEAYGPNGISSNKNKISLARYNPQTGQCLPIKTDVNTNVVGVGIGGEVTSYINHFSIYQLVIITPATTLSGVKSFPNPFYPNRSGQGHITIINLPSDAKLTFYTLTGVKVYETLADSTGTAYWDGKNSKGQFVGSGIYFCLIKSKYGEKILKLAIER